MGSVLLLCDEQNGIGLARRLAQNGTVCKVYAPDQNCLLNTTNPTVIGKLTMLEQYDIILNQTHHCESLPYAMTNSPFCQLVEHNFKYFQTFAEVAKLQTPLFQHVDTPTALPQRGERLHLEPLHGTDRSGYSFDTLTTENTPITTLAVSQSGVLPALLYTLPEGVRCYVTGWFNGEDFAFFTLSFLNLRDHDGERGPQALPHRSRGRITLALPTCDLTKPFLNLNPFLKRVDFWGPLTLEFHVSASGILLLRAIPRFFAYETFELFKQSEFDLLWQLKTKQALTPSDQYAISISLLCYSYPGVAVLNPDEGAEKHLFLDNIGEAKSIASSDLWLGQATARSHTIHEARRRAYRTIRNITLCSDVFYRTDIGCDVEAKISQLKELGVIHAAA